jgi:hypothetical protein
MASPATVNEKKEPIPGASSTDPSTESGVSELINASGHVQELDRNFNLLSAAGVGLVVGSSSRLHAFCIGGSLTGPQTSGLQ